MTDYHSHILPGIDDGSRDTEESLLLLKAEKEQGVKTVFATPHFYSQERSFNDFLQKREQAFEQIKPYLTDELPEVRLGAEVTFFNGMSRADGLPQLCLGSSRYLLVEMPKRVWSERELNELIAIRERADVKVILAHIERYTSFQKRNAVEMLADDGILMQMTGSFLTEKRTRHYGLKLIKKGLVHLIGSDCHNMKNRPPKIKEAYEIVEKELGSDALLELDI